MPNVRDVVTEVEFLIGTNPFDAASDPFDGTNVVKAARLNEGERPTDEAQTTTNIDGRETAAGHTASVTYAIKKKTSSEAVIDALIAAEDDNEDVWVRETYRPQGSAGTEYKQIIGDKSAGASVMVEESSDGFGGFQIYNVQLQTSSARAGQLINDEPTYS